MAETTKFQLAGRRIFVAGHRGMVGSALVRRLQKVDCEILTEPRSELDLTRQSDTERWFHDKRPDVVVVAAATVGGIHANNARPVEFLADNLAIELNAIRSAHATGCKKLLFLGSTCIYPKLASQPMAESELLTGPLEPTNEWYAVAKIAGIKLCQAYRRQYNADFISAMPTNLYGPNDNYHPEDSHVVAALIRRFHEAKVNGANEVVVWGTGKPRREFLHVDDLADACIFLLENYSGDDIVNIGWGTDISIAEFAELIATTVGFTGRLVFDPERPDGTPRKLVDTSKLSRLGWQAKIELAAGLEHAYRDFLAGPAKTLETP